LNHRLTLSSTDVLFRPLLLMVFEIIVGNEAWFQRPSASSTFIHCSEHLNYSTVWQKCSNIGQINLFLRLLVRLLQMNIKHYVGKFWLDIYHIHLILSLWQSLKIVCGGKGKPNGVSRLDRRLEIEEFMKVTFYRKVMKCLS